VRELPKLPLCIGRRLPDGRPFGDRVPRGGVLNGPSAASRSIMGLSESEAKDVSERGVAEEKPVPKGDICDWYDDASIMSTVLSESKSGTRLK
jgi:hypothetical protein